MTAVLATAGAVSPGAFPATSYDYAFITSPIGILPSSFTLPTGVTLTRASSGTFTDRNGTLQTVGNDVARYDWRYSVAQQAVPMGLLVEPAATQLLQRTNDFSNAIWGKNGGLTVAIGSGNGPDGTLSMAKITNSTSTFNELYQATTVTAAQPYAISAFVKFASGDTYIVQQLTQLGADYGACAFEILKGVLGYGFANNYTVVYSTMEQYANNIFRIVTVVTPSKTQATNVGYYLQTINPGTTFQSSNGSFSYISNPMLETAFNSNGYTSFFPNTGAGTTTRSADTVTLTMANATYDILVEDADGGEFRTGVVIGTGSYTLTPRTGKRWVTRVRAWTAGTLNALQRSQITPPDRSAPISPPTIASTFTPSPSPSPGPSPVVTNPGVGLSGHDKTADGWTNTFLDDFDGVVDTDGQIYFDRNKWAPGFWPLSFGFDSWGDGARYLSANVEQQIYLDKNFNPAGRVPASRVVNPFSFSNSILSIKTDILPTDLQQPYFVGDIRQFYSGMLSSCIHFSQQYGLFEVRAKLPNGPGAWPAFWFVAQMTNSNPGTPGGPIWPPEGDMYEMFPRLRNTQLHCGGIVTNTSGFGDWCNMPNGASVSSDFHVYSWQWGSQYLTYLVDGTIVFQVPTPSNFNVPMFIMINTAVGGEWYRGEANARGDPSGGGPGDYMTLVNYCKNTPGVVPYFTQYDWARAYRRTDGGTAY